MKCIIWPRMTLLLVPLVLAGCGSTAPKHKHAEPLSVAEHEQHAQAHEAEASLSHERVAPYESGGNEAECIDIGGPINTGGERTKVMKPCWTRAEQNASYLRSEAAHRSAAKDHREWAQQLLDVERVSCAGLGEIERATSPFVRGPDILSVEPYMEAQEIRGARVTFRRVRGLSKEWLLRSIRCHRARAATLGFDKAFMPFCPLALEHTASTVVEDAATVVVTLRARDAVVGAQIYGRALRAADDKGTADEAGPVKGTTN